MMSTPAAFLNTPGGTSRVPSLHASFFTGVQTAAFLAAVAAAAAALRWSRLQGGGPGWFKHFDGLHTLLASSGIKSFPASSAAAQLGQSFLSAASEMAEAGTDGRSGSLNWLSGMNLDWLIITGLSVLAATLIAVGAATYYYYSWKPDHNPAVAAEVKSLSPYNRLVAANRHSRHLLTRASQTLERCSCCGYILSVTLLWTVAR
jgi:hypothetical protein